VTLPGAYAAPLVTQLAPSVLSVDGGVVVLNGTNFGPGPCTDAWRRSAVLLRVTGVPLDASGLAFTAATRSWSPASALVATDAECGVRHWSPTGIVCLAPPGLDALVDVRVVVGGQSVAVPTQLSYAAPAVSQVAAAQAVNTTGGTVVTVTGTGLPPPPWPVAVLVGDAVCDVVPASRVGSESVSCVVPRGVGTVAVSVHSPLQASNVTGTLAYARPVITALAGSVDRPIDGGFPVVVHGAVGAD
jgi:hypothetical protein